ncbi:MAG TPA: hypothetical protein VM432_03240 [Bdellovibrionales bacterium]|jgi:hypothetical protein|nr:hypothetical protein [Bdellovibrionales bacterium]
MQIAAKAQPKFADMQERGEEETRAGLRRLAELIRDKRRSTQLADLPKPPDKEEQVAAPEKKNNVIQLSEIRSEFDSHHLIPFILKWQERRQREKSVADVVAEELLRRRAAALYRKIADSLTKETDEEEESLLPVALSL